MMTQTSFRKFSALRALKLIKIDKIQNKLDKQKFFMVHLSLFFEALRVSQSGIQLTNKKELD